MSSCSYEYEQPILYHEKFVKARKNHKCCECNSIIPKGYIYRRIKGLWDGQFIVMKQCKLCANIFIDLVDNGFCPMVEELWEFIKEENMSYIKE